MNDLALARVLHVLGVVLWIGGVALVTTVLLPAVRSFKSPAERVAFFERIEHRFAWQARLTTLLTGLTGLYLIERLDVWSRFTMASFWWLHAMVLIWALFTLMLFVLEPLVLGRLLHRFGTTHPDRTFAAIQRMHWFLLILSLVTVAGAVAGSHGWLWL